MTIVRNPSGQNDGSLGAFAKLRKETVSFVMFVCPSVCVCLSVRPSVRLQKLGSQWTDIQKN
jgi:hypothetical protein